MTIGCDSLLRLKGVLIKIVLTASIIKPIHILIWVFNKELNRYLIYYHDKLKKIFINEFKEKYRIILRDFISNVTNVGLINALENFFFSLF